MRRAPAVGVLLIGAATALAEPDPGPGPAVLPGVLVIGSTPVSGADLDRALVPQASQVLGAEDLERAGVANLTDALLKNLPSMTLNDAEGNRFQPDMLYRGFTASPVAGTAEGLAVYVNGARFNDGFGDTVNWDLIPPAAIAAVTVQGANPLFGLNALGGSVEGFRQAGTSNLYRLYGSLGWRVAATEIDLGLTAAHDILGNPGATPVEALAAGISNTLTAPNGACGYRSRRDCSGGSGQEPCVRTYGPGPAHAAGDDRRRGLRVDAARDRDSRLPGPCKASARDR